MTLYDLVARDLKKAQINLTRGMEKPNVTEEELENLREIYHLRKIIFERLKGE